MKKFYLYIFLCAVNTYAQNTNSSVGINTETPRGTLDVNGDVRVEVLNFETSEKKFAHLLATNETGEINKIDFPAIKKKVNSDVTITKLIYNSIDPIGTKETSCSNLTFKLDSNEPKIYMKLNKWFVENTHSSIKVDYGVKRWGNVSDATNGYIYNNLTRSFNSSNYNDYQELDSQILNTGSVLIFHIVLPGQGDLYRVTASRLANTSEISNYAVVCEHFYKTEI